MIWYPHEQGTPPPGVPNHRWNGTPRGTISPESRRLTSVYKILATDEGEGMAFVRVYKQRLGRVYMLERSKDFDMDVYVIIR